MTKPLTATRLPLRAYACFIGGFIDLKTIRKTKGTSETAGRLWNPKAPLTVKRVRIV